ncbi:uncharacterized protein LOC130663283 [Microplitis mediator]|uniref:uncharacterized protein LOC130663283 n=1 Tax=Microplitis mediator TaxID=375433 RepID=UPI002554BC82|nr:uncharacterized protein LOC130663283 [Microplitis mediator]
MHLSITCLIAEMVISLSVHCRGESDGYVNNDSGDSNCGNSGCNASNLENFSQPLTWGSTENEEIIFESLTLETLDGALNVIRTSFFTDENMCKGCSLLSEPGASKEVEQLILDIAKDGISIIARDVDKNEVVGTIFNELIKPTIGNEKSQLEISGENFKHNASKCFVEVNIDVESRVDLFQRYNADCIMEMTFISVRQDHRQKGIAKLLVSSSLELGKKLLKGIPVKTSVDIDGVSIANVDDIPNLAAATMTSTYSQKVADKLGFVKVIEVSFNELIFEGVPLSERIGDVHQTATIDVKSLSTN